MRKKWKWENLSKDDLYWNTPDLMIHYLGYRWKKMGFENFLDLGCGLGRNALFMAVNGFKTYAIDKSNYVINVLHDKCSEKNIEVNATVGDVCNCLYEDESIDCLAAIGVLYSGDKKFVTRVMKEIHRLLVDGGEAYVTVISNNGEYQIDNGVYIGDEFFSVCVEDFKWMFKDFEIVNIKYIEEVMGSSFNVPTYCVLLKKVNDHETISDGNIKDKLYLL